MDFVLRDNLDNFFDSKKDDLIIKVTDDGTSTSSDQVSEFPVCKVVIIINLKNLCHRQFLSRRT